MEVIADFSQVDALEARLLRVPGGLAKGMERALVEDAVFQATRVARDQLRVLPTKLATQLAYLDKPEACRKLLENEVRTILDDLSRRFRNLRDLGRGAGAGDQPPG